MSQTVVNLRAEKEALESRLLAELVSFESRFGVLVKDVVLTAVETTNIGSPRREQRTQSVYVGIEI